MSAGVLTYRARDVDQRRFSDTARPGEGPVSLAQAELMRRRLSARRSIKLISWGELLWDLFPNARRLGGASANVAYHAAQLGADSALVTAVGNDDFGRTARQTLAAAGVRVELIQVRKGARTGTVRVEIVDGEPRYSVADEVAWDAIGWVPALGEAFSQADVICFGTLAQRSPPNFDNLERALKYLKPGARVICDLNLRPPFATPSIVERALALSDVVKLNQKEAELLSGIAGVADPVRWLVESKGKKLVALTRGREGCELSDASGRVQRTAPLIAPDIGDRVGAGDAFCAALACGLALDAPLETIAERAVLYASFVASSVGAMPEIPPELRKLY